MEVLDGHSLCSPLGRSIVRRTSSVTSDDRRPFNLRSQNSFRPTEDMKLIIRSHFRFEHAVNFSLVFLSCSFVMTLLCQTLLPFMVLHQMLKKKLTLKGFSVTVIITTTVKGVWD